MWVRSQNKKILINSNAFSVYKTSYETEWPIWGFNTNDEGFTLGKYETEERAIEVLNEIQQRVIVIEEEKANVQFYTSSAGALRNDKTIWVYEMPV